MTFFDFSSLKNDVKVPSKSNTGMQKKLFLNCFFIGFLKVNDEGSGSTTKCHGSVTMVKRLMEKAI